jgi:hypothetical protein
MRSKTLLALLACAVIAVPVAMAADPTAHEAAFHHRLVH